MVQGQRLSHLLVLAVFVSGCGGTPSMDDAGSDASVDAPDTSTLDSGDCDDPDRDGDGIDSVACGGSDCDDDNENRFPGNAEVCDVDDLDEDCDPSTLGGTDVDGDGFVAAACCNQAANGDLVCGDDCNDLRIDINPSATEACDQTDNNCDGRTDEGYDPSTCWPPCDPGTLQTAPATAISGPTCEACEPGAYCPGGPAPRQPCVTTDWDHDADAGTVCVSRSSCVAGESVMNEGDATHDRTCVMCANGTYSTTPNATVCTSWGVTCAAGQYVSALPSATRDRGCQMCEPGHFSATLNAASCTAWGDCAAGTSATTPSPSLDRVCTACAAGTFTANPNTTSCSAFAECAAGELEATAPSSVQNRVCATLASVMTWTRQFGTTESDTAKGVAAVGTDAIVVVGETQGALPGQVSAGLTDAFVRSYDAAGSIVWTEQFGSSADDRVAGVASDGAGHIIVAGMAGEALPGQTSEGSADAFIRKYDTDGSVLWTRQFGTSGFDSIATLAVDEDDNIIVAGRTGGAFPTYSLVGFNDIFIAKYDSSGTRLWVLQFGVGSGALYPYALGADASGDVFVAGRAEDATLPGQTSSGGNDAFVRKYDSDGNILWTRQFGTSGYDDVLALAFNANDDVILAGSTNSAFPGYTALGSFDLILRAYDTDGGVLWTRQFGTSGNDDVAAVLIRSDGQIYLPGRVSNGVVSGHMAVGQHDIVVTRHSASGQLIGARQFGTAQSDYTTSGALVGGDLLVAGETFGVLPDQAAAGSGDAYVIRMPTW